MEIQQDHGHSGASQTCRSRRLWAVFEPRSNTSRRNVLQYELIEALKEADGCVNAAINAPEKVAPESRLNPDAVVHAITAAGREAYYEPSTDSIIDKLKARCTKGDVIIIFGAVRTWVTHLVQDMGNTWS